MNELSNLTDVELLEKRKKIKSAAVLNAGLIGFLIGIAIYSTVVNGLGFFSFFPLFFVFLLYKNKHSTKLIDDEITLRNLK